MMNTMVGRQIRLELTEISAGTVIHGIFHTSTPFRDMPHRVVVRVSSITSLPAKTAEDVTVGNTFIVNASKIKALNVLSVHLKEVTKAAISKSRIP